MRHFKKFDPSQPLLDSTGRWIKFPDFGNGWGGMSTDNVRLITEFDIAIRKQIGGISAATEEELVALKKKAPLPPPWKDSVPVQLSTNRRDESRNAAVHRDRLIQPRPVQVITIPEEPAKPQGFRPRSVVRS